MKFLIFYYFQFQFKNYQKLKYLYYQVNADFPNVNLFKPNFNGKCGKYFKYKSNNKKDLVIFAYDCFKKNYIRNNLLFMKYAVRNVLESLNYSIPNAHIIYFVTKKSKKNVVSILKEFNVEIIEIKDQHIVNRRFLEAYIYLKKIKINMIEYYLLI